MTACGIARLGGGARFVGGNSSINSGTSISVNQNASTLVGDLILAAAASVGSNVAWTPPGGFTENFDPTMGCDAQCFYGAATNSGAWSYSTSTGTNNAKGACSLTFRKGAHDVTGSNDTRSGTGSLVLPSITMSKGGVLVAIVMSSGPAATHTGPGGAMSLAQENTPAGTYPKVSMFIERVGAGATGTRTITIGGTPGDSTGLLVGITKA